MLPDDTLAVIDRRSWTPPTLFTFIERQGKVEHDEMYRVFNMGIGMVVIVAPDEVDAALDAVAREAYAIGEVVARGEGERVVLR